MRSSRSGTTAANPWAIAVSLSESVASRTASVSVRPRERMPQRRPPSPVPYGRRRALSRGRGSSVVPACHAVAEARRSAGRPRRRRQRSHPSPDRSFAGPLTLRTFGEPRRVAGIREAVSWHRWRASSPALERTSIGLTPIAPRVGQHDDGRGPFSTRSPRGGVSQCSGRRRVRAGPDDNSPCKQGWHGSLISCWRFRDSGRREWRLCRKPWGGRLSCPEEADDGPSPEDGQRSARAARP